MDLKTFFIDLPEFDFYHAEPFSAIPARLVTLKVEYDPVSKTPFVSSDLIMSLDTANLLKKFRLFPSLILPEKKEGCSTKISMILEGTSALNEAFKIEMERCPNAVPTDLFFKVLSNPERLMFLYIENYNLYYWEAFEESLNPTLDDDDDDIIWEWVL